MEVDTEEEGLVWVVWAFSMEVSMSQPSLPHVVSYHTLTWTASWVITELS